MPWSLVALALAYLAGSVLFGPLVARRAGVDLHEAGSGNPGATNVERLVGRRAALTVLVLDAAKGAIVVALARLPYGSIGALPDPSWFALAVVAGHCMPATAPTRGGKGVATALGALSALDGLAGLVFVLGYASARRASGYGSVGSLVAVGAALGTVALRTPGSPLALLGLGALVLVRHGDNLGRLVRGEEPRAGSPPPDLDEE